MKYIIIALLALILNQYLYCQQKEIKPDTTYQLREKTFKTSPLSNYGSMVIENTANQDLLGKGNGLKNEDGLIVKFNGKELTDIMWEVFSENRLKQLYSERFSIIFYFTPQGDIIQLSFGIKAKSKISLNEIYNLETKIKSSIKFDPQVSENLLKANFFWKSLSVRFKSVAERTAWKNE